MTVEDVKFRPYAAAREGRKLVRVTTADVLVAETRLIRLKKTGHWIGCTVWENDELTALILQTSPMCKICFVIFRYDDGSYDLVGQPGVVLSRADGIIALLKLLEDLVVY